MGVDAAEHIGLARTIAKEFVRRFGRRYGDAEDLAQVGLCYLVRHAGKFDPGRSRESVFVGCVLRTAIFNHVKSERYQCRDARRREAMTPVFQDSLPGREKSPGGQRLMDAELRGLVEAELSPRESEAFWLRHIRGLSEREGAKRMGIGHYAFQGCAQRAREKLRRAVARGGELKNVLEAA